MSNLQNKIDFTVLIKVVNANPNGDPLNGNRPRTTYSGHGEISDVCLKRKIRNRFQDMGEEIFVQSADRSMDECTSLSERASENIAKYESSDDYVGKHVRNGWTCARSDRYLHLNRIRIKKKKRASPWGCAARYLSIRQSVVLPLMSTVCRLRRASTTSRRKERVPIRWVRSILWNSGCIV